MSSVISSVINPVSLNSLTGASDQAPNKAEEERVNEQYEQFLTLLLTQLENQSPLDPLETEEFTAQLTSYSMLEQDVAANENLEKLITLMEGNSDFNTVAYLGSEVTFAGEYAPIQNARANWDYTFEEAVSSYTIEVTNIDGETVYSAEVNDPTQIGTYAFSMDALESAINVTEGEVLSLSVIGVGEEGKAAKATISGKAIIESVDSSSGSPILEAGGLSLNINNITGVKVPQAFTPPANSNDSSSS